MLTDFQPTAIVLPDWRVVDHPFRGPALEAFIEAIGEALNSPELPVLISSPLDVREHFAPFGVKTKQEIAEHLADEFPELQAVLPLPRGNSDREREAMSVFDALAFALAVRDETTP